MSRARRTCCACLALLSLPALPAPVRIGDFAATQGVIPAPWRVEQPDTKLPATRYRARLWDGVHAVEAHAVASMALLARPVAIDLAATPILCWRWRIDAPLQGADMTRKSGDDYAARVYLSFEVAPERLGNHLKTHDHVYWHPNARIPGVEFHSGSLGHLLSVGLGIALVAAFVLLGGYTLHGRRAAQIRAEAAAMQERKRREMAD